MGISENDREIRFKFLENFQQKFSSNLIFVFSNRK